MVIGDFEASDAAAGVCDVATSASGRPATMAASDSANAPVSPRDVPRRFAGLQGF